MCTLYKHVLVPHYANWQEFIAFIVNKTTHLCASYCFYGKRYQ